MADVVLTSPNADVPLFRRSIFTHILGIAPDTPDLVGGFPATSPAFIDAATGTVLTRAALRSYALQLAYSLHYLPAPLAHSSQPDPPTVLIFSPNSIIWPILLHGVAAAGYRATLANSAYTSTELAYQYTNSGAHLVFAHPALAHVVLDALKSTGCTESEIRTRVVLLTSGWLTRTTDTIPFGFTHFASLDTFFDRGALSNEVNFDGQRSNETLYLCYSSGTTGTSKGVETTHYNLTSLMTILQPAWPAMIPAGTTAFSKDRAGGHPDVFFGSLPYFHIYGAIMLLLFPLYLGTPTVVMAGFDPMRFCEVIERYKATVLLLVPPMLVVFARHDAIEKYNMKSIRVVFSGAAPLGADLIATVRGRLHKVGALNAVVTQAYGLTETSPTVTILHPDDANVRIGSIGRILPNIQARLVRKDGGEVLTDIDGAGELWVRGPTVMKGYLNNPSAVAAAITPDGWFKTGDIAVSDPDGFITIIDRRKELIKYKGFQVPPAELEALLLQHPDIADVAVVSVESKEGATELPRAYIVPARPIAPHDAATFAKRVQAWAAERTAAHKRLRGGVLLVEQIPKSASGKILRRVLRERGKGETGHGQVTPRAKM